ncbi:MAG: hypothetical protein HY901_09440, partial [Deltaproteobacteria bacterium]|nr:hypothetical protein [Deltaproteobacteria bacterium]
MRLTWRKMVVLASGLASLALFAGCNEDVTPSCTGIVCGEGQLCVAGVCEAGCPTGLILCDGHCINPLTDRSHCGATASCQGAQAGAVCVAGQVCAAGACAVSCQAGLVNCGGSCIDPATSRTYCGASGDCQAGNAGHACLAGEMCSGGTCALSCQAGLVNCGGSCIDPVSSRTYCGASGDCQGGNAGQACAESERCAEGECKLTCVAGLLACGNTCVDPVTSRAHCGARGDCQGG